MAWSAKEFEVFGGTGSGSTADMTSIRLTVEQSGHTLSAGDVVYRASGGFTAAQANAANTSRALGIVESVNGNEFVLVIQGRIDFSGSGVSLVDGNVYYMDGDNAGGFTSNAPTNTSYFSKPIMVGINTTQGIIVNSLFNSGETAGSGGGVNVPVGTIMPYAGRPNNIPSNWYLCAGDALERPMSVTDGSSLTSHIYYQLHYAINDDHHVIASFNDGGATGTGTINFDGTVNNPPSADQPGGNGWHSLDVDDIFKIDIAGSVTEVTVSATGTTSVDITYLAGATFAGSSTDTAIEMYGYGTGDNGFTGTIFFLPDLRSRFVVGANKGNGRTEFTLGTAGGAEDITLTLDQIPSHSHDIVLSGSTLGAGYSLPAKVTRSDTASMSTEVTGGDGSHSNLPPYHAVNYIIRWNPASGEGVEVGPPGPAGRDGADGSNGATGAVGPQGPAGATGVTGATGAAGSAGPTGSIGDIYVDNFTTPIFISPDALGFSADANITLTPTTKSGIPTIAIAAAAGSSTFATPWRYVYVDQQDWITTFERSTARVEYDVGANGFTGFGLFVRQDQASQDMNMDFGLTFDYDPTHSTMKYWITFSASPPQGASNYKLTFDPSITHYHASDHIFDLANAKGLSESGQRGMLMGMQIGSQFENADVFVNGRKTTTRTIRTSNMSRRFNFVGGTQSDSTWSIHAPIQSGAVIGTSMSITGDEYAGWTTQIHVTDSGSFNANEHYMLIRPGDYPYNISAETRAKLSGCFPIIANDTINELLTIRFPYYQDDMPLECSFPSQVTLIQNVIKFTDTGLSFGFHVRDGETLNLGFAGGTHETNYPEITDTHGYFNPLVIEGPGSRHFVGVMTENGSIANIGPNVFFYNCGKGIVADNCSTIKSPYGGHGVFDTLDSGIEIKNSSAWHIGGQKGASHGLFIYGCGGTDTGNTGNTGNTSGNGGLVVVRSSTVYRWNDAGITNGGETGDTGDTGSNWNSHQPILMGNRGAAIVSGIASSVHMPGSFIHKNGGNGVTILSNSHANLEKSYIGNNAYNGLYVDIVSSAKVDGTNILGHSDGGAGPTSFYDINANYNSIVYGNVIRTREYVGYGVTFATAIGGGGAVELPGGK